MRALDTPVATHPLSRTTLRDRDTTVYAMTHRTTTPSGRSLPSPSKGRMLPSVEPGGRCDAGNWGMNSASVLCRCLLGSGSEGRGNAVSVSHERRQGNVQPPAPVLCPALPPPCSVYR